MSAEELSHRSKSNHASTSSLTQRQRDAAKAASGRDPDPHDGSDMAVITRPNSNFFNRLFNAEQRFLEKYRQLLDADGGKPLSGRVKAAQDASNDLGKNLEKYSVKTHRQVWYLVDDFFRFAAPFEARKAGYSILSVSAMHPDLELEDRVAIFTKTNIPFHHTSASLQIVVLMRLTNDGKILEPFADQLVIFQEQILRDIHESMTESRKIMRREKAPKTERLVEEEKDFASVVGFIASTVSNSPEAYQETSLTSLVSKSIEICEKTTSWDDMTGAFKMLLAITSSTKIPVHTLQPFIKLVSIIVGKEQAQLLDSAWKCYKNLLKTPIGADIAHCLQEVLSKATDKEQKPAIRGALMLLQEYIVDGGAHALAEIPLQAIVTIFKASYISAPELRQEWASFAAISLGNPDILDQLMREDWSLFKDTLDECLEAIAPDSSNERTGNFTTHFKGPSQFSSFRINDNVKTGSVPQRSRQGLTAVANALASQWSVVGQEKQELLVYLYMKLGNYVDQSFYEYAAERVVDEALILPPSESWIPHLMMFVEVILLRSSTPSRARLHVLEALKKVWKMISNDTRSDDFSEVAYLVLENTRDENNLHVLNGIASFAAYYARDAAEKGFEIALQALGRLATLETPAESPLLNSASLEASVNRGTVFLVDLFIRFLDISASKVQKLYELLMDIALDATVPTKNRLTAMQLLVRLRCDTSRAIKVSNSPDDLNLAPLIGRTEASVSALELTAGRMKSKNDPAQPISPLWITPEAKELPCNKFTGVSRAVYVGSDRSGKHRGLRLHLWLDAIVQILQSGCDWNIYSYIIVHLPSQLANVSLFADDVSGIQTLQNLIVSQLQQGTFREPPSGTNLKKGDVALCLYHTLSTLLGYHEFFGRRELEETVRAFLHGISTWERTAKFCIHALAVCCHQIPITTGRFLQGIVQKLSQIITQSHLAMDILEFLGMVVRIPDALGNTEESFFRTIFAVSISYLEHSREQRRRMVQITQVGTSRGIQRFSGNSGDSGPASVSSRTGQTENELPEYLIAMAYHVITFWFLYIDIEDRAKHVAWIAKNLAWKDDQGTETLDEQSQVILDMMHRTAYLDHGETGTGMTFQENDGPVEKKTWLVGMSIVTVETATTSGLTHITKRQASGTTHSMYQQSYAPVPSHHTQAPSYAYRSRTTERSKVLPQHIFLQLISTISPSPVPAQPIVLPDEDFTRRAINTFDRNDTVDGYKIGVLYISSGQSWEQEILSNTAGTTEYDDFLSGLGTRVPLRGAEFNPQGLDRESDLDGTHTIAWRDRVTEIVFHVTTMMPTDSEHDPKCVGKKRHIGNDFVKIIYNDSGLPFNFETFTSQFNYVNIIITPEVYVPQRRELSSSTIARMSETDSKEAGDHSRVARNQVFFKVQTLCSESFPQISPAGSPKILSAEAMPGFVRQLALNASVFCHVWSTREGGEHVSSWRNRLREIKKLRERYGSAAGPTSTASPPSQPQDERLGPLYREGDQWKGTVAMGGLSEDERVALSVDFTRWT